MAVRFYVENLGCAKNQVDAETMIASLRASGYEYVTEAPLADVIIINSCGFIESAKKESIDTVMAARQEYPGKKILLAGCLAERYGETLADIMPEADGFFGNRDLSKVGEAVSRVVSGTRAVVLPTEYSACEGLERTVSLSRARSAYVKITEGCNNRCTYCAIPLIRGDLRSRPVDSILAEVRSLVARGVFEINLVGQDLGAYGTDFACPAESGTTGSGPAPAGPCLLPGLLDGISRIPGDFWVRLLYIHPDHFPLGILDSCARDRRILPYFDIPFQHASGPLLRSMNRKGDAEQYLALIATIRERLPAAVIRSTFLVGFPGETEADHAVLRSFQEKARLDWLGVFAYSREEDTPAYAMKAKRVPARTARQRKDDLELAQQEISHGRLGRFVGTDQTVIVEEAVEGEELWLARAWFQAPDVDGLVVLHADTTLAPGDTVRCRIAKANGLDLEAVRG